MRTNKQVENEFGSVLTCLFGLQLVNWPFEVVSFHRLFKKESSKWPEKSMIYFIYVFIFK